MKSVDPLAGNTSRALLVGLLTVFLTSADLYAHLVTTGLGPLYDGITHLFLTPEDLLPVLAFSLFAGLRGAHTSRAALFAIPIAWLTGGLLGVAVGKALNPAWANLSLLICGALVAADLRLSRRVTIVVAVSLGLFHGLLNGVALEEGQIALVGLLGIAAASFVVISLVSSMVVPLKSAWSRIAVRVAGSWVVAIGLLMLGWTFRNV